MQCYMLFVSAQVIILTRNVVLRGDESSTDSLYGMHIMVSTPTSIPRRATLRMRDVEMYNSGQAFRLGR